MLEKLRGIMVPRFVTEKLAKLEARLSSIGIDYQALNARHVALEESHQALNARHVALQESHQALNARHVALQESHQALNASHVALQESHQALNASHVALQESHQALNASHVALQEGHQALNAAHQTMIVAHQALEVAHLELATRQQADIIETQTSLRAWNRISLLAHRAQAARVTRKILRREDGSRQRGRPSVNVSKMDMQAQRDALRAAFPHAFSLWAELFENARIEYEERPLSSLSVQGNPGAAAFGEFLSLYAHGAVLDIGCGTQPLPSYLKYLVAERIVGIDPLLGSGERKFEFVQSHAEFLPWPEDEFDVVTAATSLDHVISLEMTLSEIRRVLRPGGYFVVWVGFVPGTKPYLSTDPAIVAVDKFHLFHFDRSWFIELMEKYFKLEEEFSLDSESHFYAFLKE